LLFIKY